ncbi:hypothetical protein [Psychrobacter sp. UBA2514]|mgnify:CR=1 FL=1|jgi:hypothetical protein|uniref:hypothetical protein n=1 Tax=Psychrobacter sp. UBA2514 TaxID=1947346 RepID=UPI00257B7D1A|nr:hypothetical protein [Psychrobacter sp. UBA2514]|tara:strand:+ start:4125 stop:4586 length:462 start_codon:yes stop_codon:yes gene_type:complete
MSNMMIYAPLSATGGTIENVWGTKMRVKSIDASDKDAVEQAKADGWSNKAQDVIEQAEAEKLQAENKAMKVMVGGNSVAAQLEEQLSQALTEIAELEQKLAIYEETKDTNGDGKVSYDEMEKDELKSLLDKRGVKYVSRDNLDDLIQKAKDSE